VEKLKSGGFCRSGIREFVREVIFERIGEDWGFGDGVCRRGCRIRVNG
jgi:hypothetical protein